MSKDNLKPEDVSPALHRHQITVLLIDDQAIIGEAVRRMLAGEQDIVFHFCNDPSKALNIANEISPTVILQDLVMPDVDGLTLVKFFRANPSTENVPLIVLSSKEEPKIKAEAFTLGANDYIVKLPDKIELIARIRHHSQGYINLLERNEAYKELLKSQQVLAAELAEAAEYVTSLLPKPMEAPHVSTEWKFVTSTSLGGDAFGYHWLDDDNFAIYLLDVCGHGVGAALLSISAIEVLRSKTLTDTDYYNPADVLSHLNEAFKMEEHNNMYFTIWYGIYNRPERKMTFSCGGHPPAILYSGDSSDSVEMTQLKTKGFIIGAMPGTQFENGSIQLKKYNKIFVLSDGVFEVSVKEQGGKMWEYKDFLKTLSESRKDISDVDRIFEHVNKIHGSDNLEDDFSMVQIVIN